MGKKIDLSGMKFGRLTVLCENGRKRGEICWECQCDCGNIINVPSYSLRIGETKSCGCYQKEQTSKANTIHGDAETSLWRRWVHMIDRYMRIREETLMSRRLNIYNLEDGIGDLVTADFEEDDDDFEEE